MIKFFRKSFFFHSWEGIKVWVMQCEKVRVRFNRQIPIDNFIVDFCCKELQLAIEVDGSIHFEEGRQAKDGLRQNRLESLSVYIIRLSDLDVKNNLKWVLKEIRIVEDLKPTPSPFKEGKSP